MDQKRYTIRTLGRRVKGATQERHHGRKSLPKKAHFFAPPKGFGSLADGSSQPNYYPYFYVAGGKMAPLVKIYWIISAVAKALLY